MRNIRTAWLALALVAGLSGRLGAASAPEGFLPALDPALSDALTSALENASSVQVRLAEAAVAEAGVDTARAATLPQVSGTANLGGQYEDRESDGSRTLAAMFFNATATQPLYHWGALENAKKRAVLYAEIARNDLSETRRLLQLDVLKALMNEAVAEAAEAAAEASAARAVAEYTLAEDRVAAGELAAASLGGVRNARDEAALGALRARQARDAATRLLAGLLLAEPTRTEAFRMRPLSVNKAAAEAWLATLSEAPPPQRVRTLETMLSAEKLQEAIEGVRLRPKLGGSLLASKENRNPDGDTLGRRQLITTYGAYLTVNWQVFDGFAARAAKASSKARQRQLEAQQRQALADWRSQQAADAERLLAAAAAAELAERRLAESEGGVRTAMSDVELGIAAQSLIEDARAGAASARIAAEMGRAEFHMAVATLLTNRGEPLYPSLAAAAPTSGTAGSTLVR